MGIVRFFAPANEGLSAVSPVVLRKGKYDVVIYLKDHPPAHVHIFSAEKAAKIRLELVEVLENDGYNTREIGQMLALVRDHQAMLFDEWNKYHPAR